MLIETRVFLMDGNSGGEANGQGEWIFRGVLWGDEWKTKRMFRGCGSGSDGKRIGW